MKKLIVSGCSWTDNVYRSSIYPEMDCSWTKWPVHLAKKLDMVPVNLGRSGAGNEYIYSTLHDKIIQTKDKSEIGLVVAAWTESHRRDYQNIEQFDSTYDQSLRNKTLWRNTWLSDQVDSRGNILYFMRKALRYQLSLQTLCERWDIPYVQFQMIHPYDNYMDGLEYFDVKNNKNRKLDYPNLQPEKDEDSIVRLIRDTWPSIDDNKYLGWPIIYTEKGYSVSGGYDLSWLMHFGSDDKYIIDEVDTHPNAKGHEWIANFLHTEIIHRDLI